MKAQIKSFADPGVLPKERVVISVTADHDIGKYLLLCSGKSKDGGPMAGKKDAFWFPDKPIKVGDRVVLYTKKGVRSEKKLDDGTTVHFFYWGLDAPLWNDDKNIAVLVQSAEWVSALPETGS
ncbi:hypothetical protein B0G81_8084 [Paraburkholderia sp. BL6665CI2N2]|uniref:hypothetical protein n=1 Tax=Paraburkholderia sp. BL6665CI2N2 TaxID=1938806 RepID=UPI0010664D5E|nr:hypothetical protein [Paraburkholderia sp. BL6665CI2N2]TDY16939.1 hypothetical protein B0G81_8084 [Paraburkholderia sp. BL6665CI2N2]